MTTLLDPRMQDDEPWEPAFSTGAFHIELVDNDGVWAVYDAYENRCFLYFATATEAIDACIALEAADGSDALDAEYQVQLSKARASLAAMR